MNYRLKSFEPREDDDLDFLYGFDANGIPKGWISLSGKMDTEPYLVIQSKYNEDGGHVNYSNIGFNILETDGKTIELTIGVDWNNEPIKAIIEMEKQDEIHILGKWVFVMR